VSAQTLAEMRSLLERHGLRPHPSLGQHFLADPNLIRRLVKRAGVGEGDRVLEVGAGTGTLTLALTDTGAEVLAVEIDRRLQPLLDEQLRARSVRLLFADAMTLDYRELLGQQDWKVVANLPYQVGTQLILDWLRFVRVISAMTVMVQLEVAQRLAAVPGNDAYGLPSVVAGLHSKVKIAFRVPPQVFYPRPKVESAVIQLTRTPLPDHAERAIELATAGFGQRRKMLRGSLASVLVEPEAMLRAAGIDPSWRAEQLGPDDFLRLAGVSP
jgi:16S rRNA (adenine1518-N6/adenine1519-N6)-dimethyltransferase